MSCFDRIWESDRLRSDEENATILSYIEDYRALRPPLDPSVVVDPLAYSFIRHRTHVRSGQLFQERLAIENWLSWRFISLPTPVRIMDAVVRAGYLTYVNGLDQDFPLIYAALQSTLGRCIAILERTLTSLHRSNPLPQRIRGTYRYRVWDEPDSPEDSDEEAWESHLWDRRQWSLYRPIEIPDIPEEGYQAGSLHFNQVVELGAGREVLVIHRITYLEVVSLPIPLGA